MARAGGGRPDDGSRRQGPSGVSDRSHRVRVRSRRGAVRRGRRVPGARRAPGRASRAHGLRQRRPAARGRDRGDRPRCGRRPGMAVSATVAVAGAGMADHVEPLVVRGGPAIRPVQGVTGVAPATRGWRLSLGGGSTLEAEAVILALPAWVAARLVAAAGVPAARRLDDVIYYPTTTVSLAYRGDQLATPLAGTGFVSAGEWAGVVRACSYSWLKYPGRAPPGHALLRAFVGPLDDGPAAAAHAELASILGIKGLPLWR